MYEARHAFIIHASCFLKQDSDPYSLRQSVEGTFLLPDQMSKSAVLFQCLLCPASPAPPFIYVGELWWSGGVLANCEQL